MRIGRHRKEPQAVQFIIACGGGAGGYHIEVRGKRCQGDQLAGEDTARADRESAHARLRRLRACANGAHPRGSGGSSSGRIFHKRPSEDGVWSFYRGKAGANRDSGRCSAASECSRRGFITDLSTTSKKER